MKRLEGMLLALIVWLLPSLAMAQLLGPAPGGSSSLVIGTTPITGGADTQILFNNAGVVSSDAGATKVAGATGAVTFGGVLNLPDTAAGPVGIINFGGARFIHDTGATSNVFLGHNAANLTVSGIQNVAVGESAGLALTNGQVNTFIGRFAGGGVTSGQNNTAVGAAAFGAGANAGVGNTAIGQGALGAATGTNGTAVGITAGADVLGPAGNTFLGANTGRGITTGANNTIIGAGVTGLAAGTASTIQIAIGTGVVELDWAATTAATFSVNGAIAGTLASAIGTNAVCNTPGTKTALTVQVWATGCAASSARFKDGIAALNREKALDDVLKFQPISYFYKPEFNMGSDKHVGFTAEQIGSIDPQWITYERDGATPHAVKYNEMAPLLVAAIQQLKVDNDALRARLNALETSSHR